MRFGRMKSVLTSCAIAATLVAPQLAQACGGFFCSITPINQAQEQIVFKQEGNNVTTMVQIQYSGDAAEFAWVLPVPGIPEVSTGSNAVFSPLESSTRPQFNLSSEGDICDSTWQQDSVATPLSSEASSSSSSSGAASPVEIVEERDVGPYAMQVVSSSDPAAMATWLVDNNYDLSDRGEELITPYVEMGMNFLALKLRNESDVGDIQPIILEYQSANPMIPIKLTAVAAQENMGILVWVLGESRAVPENYLSVTPNYSRVNWFNSPNAAYLSYQNLVTEAMDEAGGHGFATEYAGIDVDVTEQLPQPDTITAFVSSLEDSTDLQFLTTLAGSNILPLSQLMPMYQEYLPVADIGSNPNFLSFFYNNFSNYDQFDAEEINRARVEIAGRIPTEIVETLERSLEVFDGDHYLTRLYTTLSPEEMTVDPEFVFNSNMPNQALAREATLSSECRRDAQQEETHWQLTLGSGTERDGEVVMTGTGLPPNWFGILPPLDQDAMAISQTTSASANPQTVTENNFATVNFKMAEGGFGYEVAAAPTTTNPPRLDQSQVTFGGRGGSLGFIWLGIFALVVCLGLRYAKNSPARK